MPDEVEVTVQTEESTERGGVCHRESANDYFSIDEPFVSESPGSIVRARLAVQNLSSSL